ncbi:tRNA-binding protein [Candidatus Gracilibacteria bacterium]|nr:tRNA-binding protein [Candidatus Gracilibacteria bacterium]
MNTISWKDFEGLDMRVGTIIEVQDFPEINKPSYKVWVDFGKEIGIKKTSAQITQLYSKGELIGKQIIGVINLGPKQIGNFMSEFLITGVQTEHGVVLTTVDSNVLNGIKLS